MPASPRTVYAVWHTSIRTPRLFSRMEDAEYYRRESEAVIPGVWSLEALPVERRGYERRTVRSRKRGQT